MALLDRCNICCLPRHVDTEYRPCGLLLHLEVPIDNYPKKECLKYMKGMGSFTTRNNKTDRYFSDQNFPKDDLLHSVLSFQVVKNLSLSIRVLLTAYLWTTLGKRHISILSTINVIWTLWRGGGGVGACDVSR